MPRPDTASRTVGRKVRLATSLVAAAVVGGRAWGDETPAYWVAPVSGNWSDGTKWSTAPNFPSNTAGVDFDVTFNATGAKYQVYTPGYTVGRLTLDSPDVLLQGGVTAREVEVRQGTWWLANGTPRVNDARITVGAGGYIDFGGATFSNVTLASDLRVSASTLVVAGSLTLDNATVRLVNGINGGYSGVSNGDLRGQGRVVVEGANLGLVNAAQVIESGVELVVRDSGGQLAVGSPLARANFVSQGNVTVNAGGTLAVYNGGGWVNQGTITLAAGATLYADGFTSLGGLGTVSRAMGTTVVWNPTVGAPGTVLDLNASPVGPWELGRATLTGVTVKADGRTAGVYGPGPGWVNPPAPGVLTGVTLAAHLDFQQGAAFSVRKGLTLADASVHFKANTTLLTFDEVATAGGAPVAQTLGGTGELVFDAPPGVPVVPGGIRPASRLNTNSTLTIGPGVTVRTGTGDGQFGTRKQDGTYPTVVNQGTISARGAGRTITVEANLVNDGVVEAVDGGVIDLPVPFTNRATMRVTDATVRLGGPITREIFDQFRTTNATVEIAGTLDNTGRTVDVRDPARGITLALGGGSIKGGTVTSADGTPLRVVRDGALSDGTFAAPLVVSPGATLTMDAGALPTGGITLEGGAGLSFRGVRTDAPAVRAGPGSGVEFRGYTGNPGGLGSLANIELDGATLMFSSTTQATSVFRPVKATNGRVWVATNGVLNNAGDKLVADGGGLTWSLIGGKITGGRIEGATATSALQADSGTLENVTAAVSIRNGTNFGSLPLRVAGTFAMEPSRGAPVSMTVDSQVSFESGSVSTLQGTLTGKGAVTLRSDARVTVQSIRGPTVFVDFGGRLNLMSSADGGGLSHVRSLALPGGGTTYYSTLDVADVPVIADFFSSPRPPIAGAYAGGTWSGLGLTSSYAATHPGTAIGYAYAMDLLGNTQNPAGTILGETVGPTAVYLRLTLAGDANLDGVVNFGDLLLLAKSYGKASGWYRGDFNYDGVTNFADLLILAKNYNGARPGAPWAVGSPAAAAGFEADLAAAFAEAAVPEPSVLGGAVFAGGLWAMRRGRRRAGGR